MGHGAVFLGVELDVAVEVVTEIGEDAIVSCIKVFDDALEYRGEEIFATEGEGGSDAANITRINDGKGVADEGMDRIGEGGSIENGCEGIG